MCGSLEQVHEVPDEVSLAQQQVSPHGLQMLQQQVVTVEDVQQVFAGVKVGSVDLLLERSLQVGQQLGSYEMQQYKHQTTTNKLLITNTE